jgi:hypothetical protein
MWLLMTAMTLAAAAKPPPKAPPVAATAKQGKTTMPQRDKPRQFPDLELIGYLGDYGDAADGLDPMGLAEQDRMPPPRKPAAKAEQDRQP